jgi:uncharacterized membrane protein YozB (DUF420 family)
MIAKTREYIKNHPIFARVLCGLIFIAATFILLQYLYRSFALSSTLPGETGGLSSIFLDLIIFFIFLLIVGAIVGVFWWIHHKTKEEFPT